MKPDIDFDALKSKDPVEKYGFTRKILELAKTDPVKLYPYFDQFVALFNNENKIITWTAIDTIGLLASVDKRNKVDQQIEILLSFLSCGNLITVNHAIFSLAKIATEKRKYFQLILSGFLSVAKQPFETEECRNIALGKVILALGDFTGEIKNDKRSIDFIESVTHNTRNATKKKAVALLKKLDKARATEN